ncbi:MAG TPA: PHP domain-containing protein, partial [Rhodospirillales bacterium]|nr:PHP domain-containing protein [Rhodospirillales bacterium]
MVGPPERPGGADAGLFSHRRQLRLSLLDFPPRPVRTPGKAILVHARIIPVTGYVELAVTSNFSFLRGASHPEELVRTAAELGHAAVTIADRNSVAGIVRAHVAAKQIGIKLLIAVRLVLVDGFEVICLPQNRTAYGQLCQMLSRGNLRVTKGDCELHMDDLAGLCAGHIFIAVPTDDRGEEFERNCRWLIKTFPGDAYLAATRLHNNTRLEDFQILSARLSLPLVATNDVHYHAPNRRPLQDILTCIRHHRTIFNAGFLLNANAERYLKNPAEMALLFKGHEAALARTVDIAGRCQFSLDELAYEYPDEPTALSATPQQELVRLTWLGAAGRYPDGVPADLKKTIEHELALIEQMNYAPYFLTVDDIVRYARSLGILCQGRGSAANSAVCYCLGITSVDPTQIDLLFERFVSAERDEPPDIDVDFEHERREEVIQYIYQKYGRHRAGIAATVITYRARSAVREVGKAMGLSLDMVSALSGAVWGRSSAKFKADQVRELGLDPTDATLSQTLRLVREIIGFPRHLSQHVGGFVITQGPLDQVIPIANAAMPERTFIEWDKDDLDALGILKIDVLSLGMLTCIRKAFDLIKRHYGKSFDLATVPKEDDTVYEMICQADTLGVFQIESRAQM